MASVTINGNTYSDDASPTTGLGGGGHRARFIPLISDVVTVLGTVAANGSLTINRALASNASGQVAASSVTSTELGYLSGVTSALQTQINAKLNVTGPSVNDYITVSGSSANSVYLALNNTIAGGSNWSIASSGGGPAPLGSLVFYQSGPRLILTSSGNMLINSVTDDASGAKLQVNGAVNLTSGNSYKINNVQLVNARKTGWTAATGTASRATFATNTVTTEQLAQRVKALLDDLISHGLIGA